MSSSSSGKKKVNWSKEFVRFIRKLQNLPQYKGISYACLATHEEVKKEFQRKKQLYLHQIKMSKKQKSKSLVRNSTKSNRSKANYFFGGKSRYSRRRRTKRNFRGGQTVSPSISFQNFSNSVNGLSPVPTNLPYQGQLPNTFNNTNTLI